MVFSPAVVESLLDGQIPATTITLIPQTINGTINGISSDGSFTILNDNSTLGMDCGQLNDGVAVQPGTQAAAAGRPSDRTRRGVVVYRYLRHPDVSQ